jgi:hypothetical protein
MDVVRLAASRGCFNPPRMAVGGILFGAWNQVAEGVGPSNAACEL